MFTRIKEKFREYLRVYRITRKPDMEEFKIIVKVSGLGILVIGLLGFLIEITWRLII